MRRVFSAAAALAALAAGSAAGQAPPAPQPADPGTMVSPVTVVGRRVQPPADGSRLELYEGQNLRGGGVILVEPTPNLLARGFADRARSARATGAWQVCDGPNYTPPCATIEGDVPFLGPQQLSQRVVSARPLPPS